MKIILLTLTCSTRDEALIIANSLLAKKLVACIKMIPVTSHYIWRNTLEKSEEVLLIMESIETYFHTIEEEVRKLHSYQTFVLLAEPITQCSQGVEAWMKETLGL